MKTIKVFAVLALLGYASALKLRGDDLIDEEAEEIANTQKSIQTAEKAHGYKFNGITKEQESSLVGQKSFMNFDTEDNFLMNQPKKYSFISLETSKYPEARPIADALLQLGNRDFTDETYVASYDEDDIANTMDSLKEVENSSGKQMRAPVVDEKLYETQGNKMENLMNDNNHVYFRDLEEAQMEKEDIARAKAAQKQQLVQKKVEVQKKKE